MTKRFDTCKLRLKAKLPELIQSGLTSEELQTRLIQLGANEISSTEKIHIIGIDTLLPSRTSLPQEPTEIQQVGKWMTKTTTSPQRESGTEI